jgi:hypothetical protein
MRYEFGSFSDNQRTIAIVVGTIFLLGTTISANLLIKRLPFLNPYEMPIAISIVVVILAILWLLAKRYLDNHTTIIRNDTCLIIERLKDQIEIPISEIKSYKYNFYRGVRLVIWTRSNLRISINSNDYFSSFDELEKFCVDFDSFLNNRKTEQEDHRMRVKINEPQYPDTHRIKPKEYPIPEARNKTLTSGADHSNTRQHLEKLPERKKSFYEGKWALPFLVTFSIIVFSFVVFVYFDGGSVSGVIIVSIAGLIAMWSAYFKHIVK